MAVQPALVPLLKNSGGVDETISLNDAIPPHDAHLPLMSLPLALDIANDAELAAPAWINPDAERERYWNQWLANMFPAKALRIGIGWRGNPNYRKDASRSLDLEHFSALAAVPGISLISLQKGPGENEEIGRAHV